MTIEKQDFNTGISIDDLAQTLDLPVIILSNVAEAFGLYLHFQQPLMNSEYIKIQRETEKFLNRGNN